MYKNAKVNLKSCGEAQYRSQVHTFAEFCTDSRRAFSGSVQPDELAFLEELVCRANVIDGPIVEIGTLFGFTTQHIANWKTSEKRLITVDDFTWNPVGFDNETHREFTLRVLYYLIKHANTKLYTGSNLEFYRDYRGETPSMVFIDASHRYRDVIKDIRWAVENDVAIISGHDYADNHPGVIRAVDETFGKGTVQTFGSVWAYSNQSSSFVNTAQAGSLETQ